MGILDRFLSRPPGGDQEPPRREPRPSGRKDFVRRPDVIYRDEYMDRTAERAWVASGIEASELMRERNRLIVMTDFGMLNPRSTQAYRLGLFSFLVRGTNYYRQAVKSGNFTPGAPLRLEREPANVHDPNAIAVYAEGAHQLSGYVNKQRAKRLAVLMDSGADLAAVSVRGAGAGREDEVPHVLACERHIMEHLTRRLD